MASKDLLGAVKKLVDVATGAPEDRALRNAVNAVVKSFDATDAKVARAAITTLGKGMAKADGRAVQVLYLTLGALVEAGASPEAAWKVAGDDLAGVLERATRFARACVDQTGGETDLEEAFAAVAAQVAAKRPRDAAAWREVSARCLTGVACLARARKLRNTVARDAKLLAALAPLSEAVDEVGLLLELLHVVDGAKVLVLHPESKKGVRIVTRDVASNVELVVLASGALDGKATRPKGKTFKTKLDPIPWTSLGPDGAVPASHGDHDHDSILGGIPSDLPTFGDERVMILRDADESRPLPTDASIPGLEPEVRVTKVLKAAEVEALVRSMAEALGQPKKKGKTAKTAKAPKTAKKKRR